jgi:MarR family transcriptional regulator, transcriptional regulator for hemolysin
MDLAFMLAHASHVLSTELTAALASLGITPRGNCVLSAALTGDRTQIQLAEMCELDKTTMVVTVDELEKAGLVERQTSPTDRRARIIAVTDQGRKVHVAAKEVVANIYEDVLSSLSAAEREGFVAGLSRLVDSRLSTPVACERAPRRRN